MNELWKDPIKKKQLLYCYITFALNGMLALSVGSLMPLIRDARGLDYALCGLLVSLHSVGNFISSFFAGTFAMMWGRKKTILTFNLFFALAFLLILVSGNNLCLLIAFTMTGLARGATSNFSNFTINQLAPGKAEIMNGLHAMFSIGAFLFPILLATITANRTDGWLYACIFMLIMGVLSWLLYFRIPVVDSQEEKKTQNKTFEFFRDPMFWLCTLTLFFYLCAEQGVIGWMVTYFKDTGVLSAEVSQLMSSLLWVVMFIGRMIGAALVGKVSRKIILVVDGVGLTAFFLLVFFSRTQLPIFIGIMGVGLFMATIYTTALALGTQSIKGNDLGVSTMIFTGSTGGIITPAVVGMVAEKAGIQVGMGVVVLVTVLLLGTILFSVFSKGGSEE